MSAAPDAAGAAFPFPVPPLDGALAAEMPTPAAEPLAPPSAAGVGAAVALAPPSASGLGAAVAPVAPVAAAIWVSPLPVAEVEAVVPPPPFAGGAFAASPAPPAAAPVVEVVVALPVVATEPLLALPPFFGLQAASGNAIANARTAAIGNLVVVLIVRLPILAGAVHLTSAWINRILHYRFPKHGNDLCFPKENIKHYEKSQIGFLFLLSYIYMRYH